MSKRKTIAKDPFEDLIPASGQKRDNGTKREQQPKKERFTVHIPVDVIERIKNCVYYTPGLTIAELAEQAFLRELAERESMRGQPFPQRDGELKTGRPVK